ncbi:type VI immunity family protein [Paraburkholderia bryophila]|uniref:DUF3396 domain-containing protein n=1 Tax=Paraburkholderia bryophila TaxID=420952 RepID=A0A7Y9WK34_9BURK|nr:type VI immunity family protein [Paraburkholderia bryophila]NYH22097.1 hypothetical protein [Paraburkholderia bryophila]
MSNELEQWAQDPTKAGTLPYAAFEPKYAHEGVGAAVVVRAALYFRGGYTADKRESLSWALDAHIKLAKLACGDDPNPLRWLWFNGKPALPIAKAPALSDLATRVGDNEGFDAIYVGGKTAREASFYQFKTFCLERFQAELGTRGLDVLEFSLPAPFVRANPEPFVKLFEESAAVVDAVHGHAGLAVNLSPTGRNENESSEYFIAQQLGSGVDVGDPIAMKVRKLTDRIKTVDWLTLIDDGMLHRVGHIPALQSELPKAWFSLQPCSQGALIRAGVVPQAGGPQEDGQPGTPPPAYVVLNAALRNVVAESLGSLQRGTVSGDAPVHNTTPSSDAWLRRFDVSPDELLRAKAAVLDTTKLPGSGEA